MLKIYNLRKSFGGVKAVNNVSLEVEKGSILGLIGPNGAGKTTLINLVTSIEKADAGEMHFKDKTLTDMKPYEIAQMGIGRTFQITRVFGKMPVLENLVVPCIWRGEKLHNIKKKALECLKAYDLAHMKNEFASNLSGGQQKVLEFLRVSMMDPELFLLDEPFFGIHPALKNKILDNIVSLNRAGKTFLIVSHDIPSIMKLCRKVVVMSSGEVIARGNPEEIRNNQDVIKAYLGL